jgi:hypothetical protein
VCLTQPSAGTTVLNTGSASPWTSTLITVRVSFIRSKYTFTFLYILSLLSARSLRTNTHDLVVCLAPVGRRPIRASVATVSFKLV